MKKTAIAAALAATMGMATTASADVITMSFDGLFTLGDSAGVPQLNADAGANQDYGFRTNVTGTGSFDTVAGTGTAQVGAFSFFGGGLASATNTTFQAIGDGNGGPGSLVLGSMGFNWNGNVGIPVVAIFDAAGFFGSIGAVGSTWTVGAACTGCATSATADWAFGPFGGSVGAVPMAMTTLNSAFPTVADGVSGSPMTTAPFPGFNANFDFTSITATNTGTVPVPAAVWLFGSGLVGLAGVARRRRS